LSEKNADRRGTVVNVGQSCEGIVNTLRRTALIFKAESLLSQSFERSSLPLNIVEPFADGVLGDLQAPSGPIDSCQP
jgi:hypothetical protein